MQIESLVAGVVMPLANKSQRPPAPRGNTRIHDFFKPADPTQACALLSRPARPLDSSPTRRDAAECEHHASSPTTPAKVLSDWTHPQNPSELDTTREKPCVESNAPSPSPNMNRKPAREIVDSEDEDSDSSLPSLSQLFGPRDAPEPTLPRHRLQPPHLSTPKGSRGWVTPYGSSPLSHRPKQRIDFKSLAAHTKEDAAIEASTKRLKAMLAEAASSPVSSQDGDQVPVFAHEDVLNNVVAEKEDGGKEKVMNALRQTEAMMEDTRWYFFDKNASEETIEVRPVFPTSVVPECMQDDFVDPITRRHNYISGFAECIAEQMSGLPDEVLLWMWSELWHEDDNQLREAYVDTLKAPRSRKQLGFLLSENYIRSMCRRLGATLANTDVTQAVKPLSRSKPSRMLPDRMSLRYAFQILEAVSPHLSQQTRTFTISLLLRMSVDRMLVENADILALYQDAMRRLCEDTEQSAWKGCSQQITIQVFNTISSPVLRHNIILTVPSTNPRLHHLRLQLSTAFFFDTLSHVASHLPLALSTFTAYISSCSIFRVTPHTNYHELYAIFHFLSIAVADGLSPELFNAPDYVPSPPSAPPFISTSASTHPPTDPIDASSQPRMLSHSNLPLRHAASPLSPDQETAFHKSVDKLTTALSRISIPTGAGKLSRAEAREMLDLVRARIKSTLRLKPRPKISLFDGPGTRSIGSSDANLTWETGRGFVKMRKPGGGHEDDDVDAAQEGMRLKMKGFLTGKPSAPTVDRVGRV